MRHSHDGIGLGSLHKPRLSLRVSEKGAHMELYGKNHKAGVQLFADEESGLGQVGVFEASKPRAVMGVQDGAATVAVMHDDGFPRAMLRTDGQSGQFFATNQDLKTIGRHVATGSGNPCGSLVLLATH